jgi:hypothetical protein
MEFRRSRRLAGLEPESSVPSHPPTVSPSPPTVSPTPPTLCSTVLGAVGGCLLTYGLGNILIAFANAPGYILF